MPSMHYVVCASPTPTPRLCTCFQDPLLERPPVVNRMQRERFRDSNSFSCKRAGESIIQLKIDPVCACVCACARVCAHRCVLCAGVCVHVCLCACVCVYVRVCMSVCGYRVRGCVHVEGTAGAPLRSEPCGHWWSARIRGPGSSPSPLMGLSILALPAWDLG